MKCRIPTCPGHYEPAEITRTEHHGGRMVVFENVPVETCSVCGDTLLTPEVAEQLDELRRELRAGEIEPKETAGVYAFGQARRRSVPQPA